MPFKFGTSNVSQVRHKMTPTVVTKATILFPVYFMQDSLCTHDELVRREKITWASHVSSRTICHPSSRQKWAHLVQGKQPRMLPWQHHNGYQFASYLVYNYYWYQVWRGEIHVFLIIWFIFLFKPICEVINFLTKSWMSWEWKEIFQTNQNNFFTS